MYSVRITVKGTSVRVMTFNIRHGRGMGNLVNIKRTIADIMASKADIIGLQEVDRYNLRSGYKDQVRVVAQALDMYWTFSPCIQSGRRQYGNAILSKYPIKRSQITTLSAYKERRMALQADILVADSLIQVVNTHLGVSHKEHQLQMPILMNTLQDTTLPMIIMGDFNMEMSDPLMAELKHGWNKAVTGQPTFYKGTEIDHIFVSTGLHVTKAWTHPTRASDHYPVIAEIMW